MQPYYHDHLLIFWQPVPVPVSRIREGPCILNRITKRRSVSGEYRAPARGVVFIDNPENAKISLHNVYSVRDPHDLPITTIRQHMHQIRMAYSRIHEKLGGIRGDRISPNIYRGQASITPRSREEIDAGIWHYLNEPVAPFAPLLVDVHHLLDKKGRWIKWPITIHDTLIHPTPYNLAAIYTLAQIERFNLILPKLQYQYDKTLWDALTVPPIPTDIDGFVHHRVTTLSPGDEPVRARIQRHRQRVQSYRAADTLRPAYRTAIAHALDRAAYFGLLLPDYMDPAAELFETFQRTPDTVPLPPVQWPDDHAPDGWTPHLVNLRRQLQAIPTPAPPKPKKKQKPKPPPKKPKPEKDHPFSSARYDKIERRREKFLTKSPLPVLIRPGWRFKKIK